MIKRQSALLRIVKLIDRQCEREQEIFNAEAQRRKGAQRG
jgi:hypothetical protein